MGRKKVAGGWGKRGGRAVGCDREVAREELS